MAYSVEVLASIEKLARDDGLGFWHGILLEVRQNYVDASDELKAKLSHEVHVAAARLNQLNRMLNQKAPPAF